MEPIRDLRECQRRAGAVFAPAGEPVAGERSVPLNFGHPREEYSAASSAAAIIDWSDRAILELSGADRVAFLHNFCTNDIKRLSDGQGCEAFIANVKGRILGYVWIDVCELSIWLDAGPVAADRLIAHLERYVINEDVAIADRTAEFGELLVMGPTASTAVSALLPGAEQLPEWANREVDRGSHRVRVSRRSVGRLPAFVVSARREFLADCWTALRKGGGEPAGMASWTALRVEAGLPVYGVDLTDDNLAQEAGRTREAISFTKGCYLGQEPIARIDAMGHVNRELRSLRIAGDVSPPPGVRVFSDAAATAVVGTVTSSAFSFGSNSAVALALVRASATAPRSQVFVETGSSIAPATVFWLPAERGPTSAV